MKTIHYVPKFTTAKTEYRTLSEDDHSYILDFLMKTLVKMGTLSNTKHPDETVVRDQWWRTPRDTLPRGRQGMNSPESMVSGILLNMMYAKEQQRDFTRPQCEAVEEVSNWMNALDQELFDQIRFQIRVI